MERPLKKRVSDALGWSMWLEELPHTSGLSIPVFRWSFGSKGESIGGDLRVFPHHGILTFQSRRSSIEGRFESVEKILAQIDKYGWGEPPHIDEVFQDAQDASVKVRAGDKEAAEQIFEELRQKWQTVAS